MRPRNVVIIFFFFISTGLKAQSVRDTLINIAMFGFHYSFHMPAGDMADRFGNSNTVGGDFVFKSSSGWIAGLDYSFLFGEKIINRDDYFKGIRNKQGFVIDGNGMLAEVFLYERGFNAAVILGKQFNIWNPNPNSGPFIQLHGGFMQHYVRIENPYKTAPQVNGDYAKLYDRMTAGFSLSEFVGYRFMGNNRLWNFYAGFEFIQGFTKGMRTYNADDMTSDESKRHDLLYGIRVGWVIPLYGKTKRDFYYF